MKKEQFRKAAIYFMLVLSLMAVVPKTEVMAITKAEVQKKVSSLSAEIKKLKKQKSEAVAKEKKQKKGLTYVYGEVLSQSPLVVKNLTGKYLYITDSKYLDNWLFACFGYVQKTGQTTVYYQGTSAYTCSMCKSVKVSNQSENLQSSISKKSKSLKTYQNALKDVFVLPSSETYQVGDVEDMDGEWKYSGKYNKIKWSSSDKSIATVNANGRVKAFKEGTVTISAKASISGKVSKCKLKVVAKPSEEVITEENEKDAHSYTVYVWSPLVESMKLKDGKLYVTADSDSEYDAFTKGESQTKIEADEISYEIDSDCTWERDDYYVLEDNKVENLSSFEEIRECVEKDRTDFLNGEYPTAYMMELIIQNDQLVRVIYTHNVQ